MSAPRLAYSLVTLRAQINATFPDRSKASDGWIGDAAHQAQGSDSDHNPWYPPGVGGIVTAIDVTNDPAHGVDTDIMTDQLAASRDPRIKYIIANGWILDSRPQFHPWEWVRYTGSDPHNNHMHISAMDNPSCDDPHYWNIPMLKGSHHMELSDLIKSELNNNEIPLGALFGWWDKWIVETWRNTQNIKDIDSKLAQLIIDIEKLTADLEKHIAAAKNEP